MYVGCHLSFWYWFGFGFGSLVWFVNHFDCHRHRLLRSLFLFEDAFCPNQTHSNLRYHFQKDIAFQWVEDLPCLICTDSKIEESHPRDGCKSPMSDSSILWRIWQGVVAVEPPYSMDRGFRKLTYHTCSTDFTELSNQEIESVAEVDWVWLFAKNWCRRIREGSVPEGDLLGALRSNCVGPCLKRKMNENRLCFHK